MKLDKLITYALDIFFPPLCVKCHEYLKNDEKSHLLCRSCFDSISVNRVITHPDKDTTLFAVGRYDDLALRELIHSFKYNKFIGAKNTIRSLIKKYLSEVDLVKEVGKDAILVPIPLHPSRLRARGFNQSEIIANELSQLTDLKVDSSILRRVKNTATQINLDSYEKRRENLKDSFEVLTNYDPKDKTIVLIDDVYTSGATTKEAMRTLKHAGVENMVGFVMVRA